MKTQNGISQFREKVENLIQTQEGRTAAPAVYAKNDGNYAAHQKIAVDIFKHLIEPRIELAADMFEGASVEVNAEIGYVRLSFLAPKLQARLYLLFCLRIERSARMLRLYAESCLRPYTKDYQPAGSLIIPLNFPDPERIEAFVEEQILKFLKGYLRLRREEQAESLQSAEQVL